jgi:hypothetical protein
MTESTASIEPELAGILRLDRPSEQSFREACLRDGQPAVITGAMDGWKALAQWSVSYFESALGSSKVRVLKVPEGEDGGFFQVDDRKRFPTTDMTMKEYLESLAQPGKPRYYLSSASLRVHFPSLLEDFEGPVYVPETYRAFPRLWVGKAGTVSPLHYDASDKIHALVSGRKHFLLFDRNQYSLLYPNSFFSNAPHISRVRFDRPDLRRFPRFRQVKARQTELRAGEMLFLPAGWWHQVTSLETSIALEFPWPGPRWGRPFVRLAVWRMHQRWRRRLAALVAR